MKRRLGRWDHDGTPWTVLSDLAITMVLVLVVYLVLQFLVTFREQYIRSQILLRQQEVRQLLSAEVPSDTLRIDSIPPNRQKLTFRSELLFPECGANLTADGAKLMARIGRVLASVEQYFESVQIDGHTDRQPIGTCRFESNWELSSRRATSVVHLFDSLDLIDNRKLSATGWAEFQPIDTLNFDPNRRIELKLLYSRRSIEAAMRQRSNAPGS